MNKKGLKSLARLLISTLNKKKFDSSKYLTEEIEDVLLKQKKLSKNVIIELMFSNKQNSQKTLGEELMMR